MNIAICDDEKTNREILLEHLKRIDFRNLEVAVTEFSCGEDLLSAYNTGKKFDIIFLDIKMEKLSGIEVGYRIRNFDPNVIIIFLTAYSEYVFEATKVEMFDYLLKPIDEDELRKTFNRAIDKYKRQHFIINIEYDNKLYKLNVKNIIYINMQKNNLIFHLIAENSLGKKLNTIECRGNLNNFEYKLSPYGFIKCHKGILVNVDYVDNIEGDLIVTIIPKIKLKISRRMKTEFIEKFKNYICKYSI